MTLSTSRMTETGAAISFLGYWHLYLVKEAKDIGGATMVG